MTLSTVLFALAMMSGANAPSAALADLSQIPPQTAGRLDTLGGFAAAAPFCELLGYATLDPDRSAFKREIAKIATRVGVDPRDAEAAVEAARTRDASDLSEKLERVRANLADSKQDGALRAFADELAVRCDRGAVDPVASVLMKPPPGRATSLSLKFSDSLLAPYGRAGWQSPYILAGGDLAEAVGSCEARIGRAEARTALAELRDPTRFPPDINDTIQAWLDQRLAKGRKASGKAPPTAPQCAARLAKQKSVLSKAPVD